MTTVARTDWKDRESVGGMLWAAWRDLGWRRRRFAIVVIGTALVFAVTLITTGVARGLDTESSRTVRHQAADAWYVDPSSLGPYFGAASLQPDQVEKVRSTLGTGRTSPTLFTPGTLVRGATGQLVPVFGAIPGRPGFPHVDIGRAPSRSGEAVLSTRLSGYRLGGVVNISGEHFTVVGKVRHATSIGGHPDIFLTLTDLQGICCAGLPVVWAVAVRGASPQLPGLRRMTSRGVWQNLAEPGKKAKEGVVFLSVLLWFVAAAVIGASVYLSATERTRDFAVFKTTGVRTVDIVIGLVMQAILLSVVAAALGAVASFVIGPFFPLTVDLTRYDITKLVGISVVIGLVASLFGVRRATSVDPVVAFGAP